MAFERRFPPENIPYMPCLAAGVQPFSVV